jgi:hypothetical protein
MQPTLNTDVEPKNPFHEEGIDKSLQREYLLKKLKSKTRCRHLGILWSYRNQRTRKKIR